VLSTFGTLLFYVSHSWYSTSLCLVLGVFLTLFFSVFSVLDTLLLYMFSVLGVLLLCVWHYWHFVSLYLTLYFLKAWLCLEQQVVS